MEWIVLLYILFIVLSGIFSAIKEAQKKQTKIPKKLEPILIEKEIFEEKKIKEAKEKTKADIEEVETVFKETEGNVSKAVYIIEHKGKSTFKMPEEVEKIEKKTYTFIEKDIKEKLPEIIILMEILGPPKAFQKPPLFYRRRVL
jgi:ABC-type Na+ efflux pump permease subunit